MADPIIILLLVASPEVGDNVTSAMSASAREALGPTAHVLVENRIELPPDEEALTLARQAHATAVVELRWANGPSSSGGPRGVTRMQLHAHVSGAGAAAAGAKEGSWVDRTLTFANIDDPGERGRTVGLAVASMIPLEWRTPPPPAPPVQAHAAPTVQGQSKRELVAVDLLGMAAVGGAGSAWGGEGRVRVNLGRMLAVQALGNVRFGSVSDAEADARTIAVGGGLVVRLAQGPRWEIAVAGDALALGQSLQRGDATEARWILAAQLTAEGAWFFSEHVGFVGAVGEEVGFGATRVFVGPDRVATLSPFQTMFKLGLRARF